MSRNLDLNVLHVDDAAAWADTVAWRPVSGDTLVFDYVYFLHPVRLAVFFFIIKREHSECMQQHVSIICKYTGGRILCT